MTNTVLYDLNFNNRAHYLSTIYGCYRLCVHAYSLAGHIKAIACSLNFEQIKNFQLVNKSHLHLVQATLDLRGIIRGVIELPPILGGLGSWLWDKFLITPAQRLAFRIQEIYQTRLNQEESYLNDPDLQEADLNDSKYTDDFRDFVNGESVRISINPEMNDLFVKSFLNADVSNSIFKNKNLPFYALAAFADRKIDRDDMATILEYYMARQCFEDCTLCNTFDQYGEVTQEAAEYYTYLLDGKMLAKTQENFVENYKNSIKELPRRKQIFWHNASLLSQDELKILESSNPNFQAVELLYSPKGSLYASLAAIGALKTSHGRNITLSFAVERILLNQQFNKDNDPFNPKLGKFAPLEIKKDVMDHSRRLCATFFPGTSKIKEVHNSLELPTTIIGHDKSHAKILQFVPKEAEADIKYLVAKFQEITGFKMSREIWQLIEMVTPALFIAENLNEPQKYLCKFINDYSSKIGELFMGDLFWGDSIRSPLYWIIVHEIIKNPNNFLSKESIKEILADRSETDKEILKSDYSLKQKIWMLQQNYRNIRIESIPEDNQLVFKKVTEGPYKNTIILTVSQPALPSASSVEISPSRTWKEFTASEIPKKWNTNSAIAFQSVF